MNKSGTNSTILSFHIEWNGIHPQLWEKVTWYCLSHFLLTSTRLLWWIGKAFHLRFTTTTSSMPWKTTTTPRCKLKWRRSKPSSSPTSDLPHLREDAQEHMLPSYHLQQDHIGIDTITNKNVKVKSSTPTTAQRLHHLPWHLRQATSRHLRLRIYGIFADKHLKTTLKRSSPSSSPRLPRATMTST